MGTICASADASAVRPPAPSEYGYMFVRDMNGDKRVDILTTMGHSCGVLWFERAGDGNWTRHVIDDASWACIGTLCRVVRPTRRHATSSRRAARWAAAFRS